MSGLAGEPDGTGDARLESGREHQQFVLALDIGTTVMRGHVYDVSGHVKGASSKK
ncbi:hypothetical protein BaRGS_00040492, partial [Batillaria attramentaria]